MTKFVLDLSLYFIVDPAYCAGRNVADVAAAAVRGGARVVQYRDKDHGKSSKALHQTALKIKDSVKSAGKERGCSVSFLVNDHVDLARAVEADGVHLGQGDGDPVEARRILGPEAIIGWTAFETLHFDTLKSMLSGTVDYVGTGPFYPTKAKQDKPVLGAQRFSQLVDMSSVPVVGIGGITAHNAEAVIRAGASGVAVMSGIGQADDVECAAQAIKEAVRVAK